MTEIPALELVACREVGESLPVVSPKPHAVGLGGHWVNDEEYRHQCECREWMRRRREQGPEWLRRMLAGIEKARGKEAAERLKRDIATQWRLGNRGAPGDWREPA